MGKISDKDLPHIFDQFFRGDSSKSSQGNGLGLSITKSLVTSNGGNISVESEDGKIVFSIEI